MKTIYTETHRRHAPSYEFAKDRMRPYSEPPARVDVILQALQRRGLADIVTPREYPLDAIKVVHDADYLHYLENIYTTWIAEGQPETGVIPYTFAVRTLCQKPDPLIRQVGYYGFDAQTPIVEHTYDVALSSAYCALTGADMLLTGETAVYVLCRPPGHHAGRDLYGGYCYLNNAAIAATHLSRDARVALLDVDYHHGNGTQDIFYDSDQILFVSIHGDPHRTYPFFSGFIDERGVGAGRGFNHNLPLAGHVDEGQYLTVLDQAAEITRKFGPEFLVVSVSTDMLRDDPFGGFDLPVESCSAIGERIARIQIPTLLVQEGGYNLQQVGEGVVNMLRAFERRS